MPDADYDPTPRTTENRGNAPQHSDDLLESATKVIRAWKGRQVSSQQNDPTPADDRIAHAGIPLLLEVEDSADVDWLRTAFGFHVVSEEEEGFVIVAAHDIDLNKFNAKVVGFGQGKDRTGMVAKLYSIEEDDDKRLERILSDELLEKWHTIDDYATYTVDVGVSCGSDVALPQPVRKKGEESDDKFQERLARYVARRDSAQTKLEEIRIQRETDFERFLAPYNPHFLGGYVDGDPVEDANEQATAALAEADENQLMMWDSFTTRISISGKGLRDLILNFPYVFEVSSPDLAAEPLPSNGTTGTPDADGDSLAPVAPRTTAKAVCVIDSGIQEQHKLLARAIDTEWSFCYVPGKSSTDVADYVTNGGHGTRVAGVILYPDGIPDDGEYELPFWIQNARVLDDSNSIDPRLRIWEVLPRIVSRFKGSPRKTRLYNQSITGSYPHRMRHMSAWAAAIDALSFEEDVLFMQSAGNISPTTDHPYLIGIREHFENGAEYPAYLLQSLCRIPNPAQSLQAITVGSIIRDAWNDGTYFSFGGADKPSSYSRAGLGIWSCVKPDVVEYGGDYARDGGNPPTIRTDENLAPETVRSTLTTAGGPDRARDAVGTSFSAPRVTHIAAKLEELLPDEPTLLYRALIAQSAQWPLWATNQNDKEMRCNILRHLGYGVPMLARATSNDDYRVTLITAGEQQVHIGEAHIYEIAMPSSLRDPGEDHDIRIEISMSYSALPRRTRRDLRGYLAAHVEWETIRLDESAESFKKRIFLDDKKAEKSKGSLDWFLHKQIDWGDVRGTSRNHSTLQKDWTTVKSSRLPETFAIAVIGRRGWSNDPETYAKYALAVTFEAVGREIEVYEPIRSILIDNIDIPISVPQTELQLEIGV